MLFCSDWRVLRSVLLSVLALRRTPRADGARTMFSACSSQNSLSTHVHTLAGRMVGRLLTTAPAVTLFIVSDFLFLRLVVVQLAGRAHVCARVVRVSDSWRGSAAGCRSRDGM